MSARPRVVIVGAGFAGLEAVFCLRHQLGDAVELTLVSNDKNFVFRPDTIYIPFGADPKHFVVPLARPLAQTGVTVLYDRAHAIDRDNRRVVLREQEVPYDFLVVATGASVRAGEIPGLEEHATSLWTAGGMLKLRRAYEQVVEDVKRYERRQLLFLAPRHNRCPSAVYEMVFMTDAWLRSKDARERVELTLATHEDNLIEPFGLRFDGLLRRRFAESGVTVRSGHVVTEVEHRHCCFQNGERLRFDVLVSFPPHVVPKPFEGLPNDERGFVRVDQNSRRVHGDGIFAAGDASVHPAKRAYLALLQADTAAEHIAAEIEGRAPTLSFKQITATLLETVREALFDPRKSRPEERLPEEGAWHSADHYEVGISPLWRAGARASGLHLPWRFGPGEPFHTKLQAGEGRP